MITAIQDIAIQVLDAMECCHRVQRYAATWGRSGTLLICRPVGSFSDISASETEFKQLN
jgi:hypothetical protein